MCVILVKRKKINIQNTVYQTIIKMKSFSLVRLIMWSDYNLIKEKNEKFQIGQTSVLRYYVVNINFPAKTDFPNKNQSWSLIFS